MTYKTAAICLMLLLGLGSSQVLVGQSGSTQIVGLVTDQTAAVIPGAEITTRRMETGDVQTTATNATGNYVFPLLERGTYEVTCSVSGFKTEVRRDVILQLQQKLRLDFRLQIGEQVETVEVVGDTPLLGTEDATVGAVIEHKRVVDLPLNGRNFGQLATLMPGAVVGIARMGLNGQGGRAIPGTAMAISVNGQRGLNQNVTLDGVSAQNPRYATMHFIPSIEAVEEFKVQSAVYTAEYGMNSGAQINLAIRSGTNQFHGTAFEFLRNDKVDARGFFLPRDQQKNKLRKNQFGGVFSGPVKKNKTFFLFNTEFRRERRGTPSALTVPTPEFRQGDFSELIQPGNRWYPKDADPAVTRAIRLPGSDTPFPNNIIPQSLINPVSKNVLTWGPSSPFADGGFIAPPNRDTQARAEGDTVNLVGTNSETIDVEQYLGRGDHRFGDNDRLFVRYMLVNADRALIPLQQAEQRTTVQRGQNLAIGYTKMVTPTVLNEFRYGYNREVDDTLGLHTLSEDFDVEDLGFDIKIVPDNNRPLTPREQGLPQISISGFTAHSLNNLIGRFNVMQVHDISDNVSINRGKHNFKFGAIYRYNTLDTASGNSPRGTRVFTRDIESIPDAMAAFMLGIPTRAQTGEGKSSVFLRQNKWGFYFLDDYKATSRLTINMGVRWDIAGVVTDPVEGKIRNLSFEDSKARSFPIAGLPGGMATSGVVANLTGMHPSDGVFVPMLIPDPFVTEKLYDVSPTQIMPRLGIAYRLTDSLVIRTGAGQFYNMQQMGNFNILALAPPFSGSTIIDNDRMNPQARLGDPFAGTPRGAGPTAIINLGNFQADRANRSLYLGNDIWQWSFQIEKSFSQDLVTSIGYVGSAASNIDMPIQNFNNPDPGVGNIQERRPLPFYVDSREPDKLLPLGTLRTLDTSASTNYNALQFKAEQRYARGLTFTASFNYQKGMGIGFGANEGAGFGGRQTQDPRNREADYARSNIDQRFRFVFSHIYEIPWMRNAGGLKGALLGGWAVNGIIQLTSGLPVTVTQSGDSHNTGARDFPLPHIVPGGQVERVMEGRTIQRWFNTDAFVRSKCEGCSGSGFFLGPKGYGSAGLGLFDAPAQKTWDFALFKEFQIKEGHRLQFRWESFNFLNTPQFTAPRRGVGSSGLGRITSTLSSNREMQFGLKYMF